MHFVFELAYFIAYINIKFQLSFTRMVLHSNFNWNSSLLAIVLMNVLAFILCLCAIFLPSMPNEDGKKKIYSFLIRFSCCCLCIVCVCVCVLYFLASSRYLASYFHIDTCRCVCSCLWAVCVCECVFVRRASACLYVSFALSTAIWSIYLFVSSFVQLIHLFW